ncbi:MAG TPA: hypothetical protein VHH88_00050, partial [Verrucomicrobiae bacterium]|nr:hypothetical protein [Verrucomicrobiae bacterium]
MLSIADYTSAIKLSLGEAGKYFALLLLVVIAVRLWRRAPRVSGSNRTWTLILAFGFSFCAAATGYVGMRHSLGLLYSHYAMRAFHSGHISAALSLFRESESFWKEADTVGEEGVCLLLLDDVANGER